MSVGHKQDSLLQRSDFIWQFTIFQPVLELACTSFIELVGGNKKGTRLVHVRSKGPLSRAASVVLRTGGEAWCPRRVRNNYVAALFVDTCEAARPWLSLHRKV